jgi:hypothetical protein
VRIAWDIQSAVVVLKTSARANCELRAAILAAMASAKFPKTPTVLLDLRLATENPSSDVLRQWSVWIATLLSRRYGSRCAILIGRKPVRFGVARMLSAFLESEGINTETFTILREARRWLTPSDGSKRTA